LFGARGKGNGANARRILARESKATARQGGKGALEAAGKKFTLALKVASKKSRPERKEGGEEKRGGELSALFKEGGE